MATGRAIERAGRMGFALACAASLSAAASRDTDGWMVSVSKDGKGCFLTRVYDREEGATTLLLGIDTDDSNRLSLLNENWSIKAKDRLTLNFRLSNGGYPAHFAFGIVSDGKQGFVTSFGTKFPAAFAASQSLRISRGDVPVEDLSLDGSGAAVAELRTCVDGQREKPATASGKNARSDAIPKDPFAPVPARGSKK